MNKQIWVKTNWKAAELNHKTVEFRIPAEIPIYGIGEFWATPNQEGLLSVELVHDRQGKNWAQRLQTVYFLPQEAVDRIAHHPDSSIADFRLE